MGYDFGGFEENLAKIDEEITVKFALVVRNVKPRANFFYLIFPVCQSLSKIRAAASKLGLPILTKRCSLKAI